MTPVIIVLLLIAVLAFPLARWDVRRQERLADRERYARLTGGHLRDCPFWLPNGECDCRGGE